MNKNIGNDIYNFIVKLVTMTDSFVIDDEGYIAHKNTNGQTIDDRVVIKTENSVKYLVPYQDSIKQRDAIVLNPFVEGLGSTYEMKWFYATQSLIVAYMIKRIFKFIIENSIKSKSKDAKKLNNDVIKMISPYIDQIDEKTLDELNYLTSDKGKDCVFFNIHYVKTNRTASCYSALLDSEFIKKNDNKKIRKKTLELFSGIMTELFKGDPDNLMQLKFQSKNKFCPNLDAFLNVMWMVLSQIKGDYEITGGSIDLDFLADNINRLEEYHNKSKWLAQPTAIQTREPDKATSTIKQIENIPPWYAKENTWGETSIGMQPKRYSIAGSRAQTNVLNAHNTITNSNGFNPNSLVIDGPLLSQSGMTYGGNAAPEYDPYRSNPYLNSGYLNNRQESYNQQQYNTNMYGKKEFNPLGNIVNVSPI